MAKNDNTRSHQGGTTHNRRATGADRDRRRDAVVNTVKERPYAAAALATVAAGAAAFFLTRSKNDKPLMNWGQDTTGDTVKDSSSQKQQGSTTSDRSIETASTSPSSSAGSGAGTGGTSPSAVRAASLSATPNGTNAATTPGTGAKSSAADAGTNTKPADAGLDHAAKTETKVGAISYGA